MPYLHTKNSNYIDRTNLAFASVQLNADIGLSPSIYGLGSGLFFISYACELVANTVDGWWCSLLGLLLDCSLTCRSTSARRAAC